MDTVHNIPQKDRKTGKLSNNAKLKIAKNRIFSMKKSCKKYQNNVTYFQNLQNSGNFAGKVAVFAKKVFCG